MKIVFLCGSLEPGRDGVGDYVRQLAVELLRQGHQATAIALNDQHIAQESSIAQQVHANELAVLRLPSGWPAGRRFGRAQQWVADFNPDWVSLQFVPYAFHAKGLPILLSRHLGSLIKGRQVHVMMHEAWAGEEPGTGLKRRLVSLLQKAVIGQLLRGLGPAVLHTHLPIYRTRIQSLGWTVLPLPLFSNIPVIRSFSGRLDSGVFRIGVFSQADDSKPFIDFLVDLAGHLTQRHQSFQVLLLGGEATRMQALKTTLEGIAPLSNRVYYAGFLEPAQLSEALQTCSLGLTAVPRHSLGKSGSVAAFLAHGVPVAAPYVHSESVAADVGFFHADLRASILLQPDTSSFEELKAAVQIAQSTIQVATIAQLFLTDLADKSM